MSARDWIVAVTAALASAVLLAGCGGSAHPAAAQRTSPSPAGSSATSASASASGSPTATPAAAASGPAAPAGGPVPAGFTPASVTAISTSTFWVLGNAPCSHAPCTSLVRTTDGGAHFVGLPAPRAPLAGGANEDSIAAGGVAAADVSQVRFADAANGWAFGPALWSTHDGGAHWTPVPVPGQVLDLAAADGQVWALGGDCHPKAGCSSFWLRRSAVGTDAFAPVSLPVPLAGNAPPPALAVGAGLVVVMDNGVGTGTQYHGTLLVAHGASRPFARYSAPCSTDLGGSVSAAPGALWAVCSTGMMSSIFRSTDGGAQFTSVPGPAGSQPNSALLAPASATEAFLANAGGGIDRTTDA